MPQDEILGLGWFGGPAGPVRGLGGLGSEREGSAGARGGGWLGGVE